MFTSLDTKIYNLTPKTQVLTSFLTKNERKQKKASDDESYHLLQEGSFPHLATNIRISPNGEYMMATGSYPHQLRMFDLHNASIKFQRNQQNETVDLAFLDRDWKKLALALDNKSIEVHSQQGKIFGARVPFPVRSICYDQHEATLCVAGSGSSILLLDLYQGKFRPQYQLQTEFINQLHYDTELELLFSAGQRGIHAIDQRVGHPVGFLETQRPATSVASHHNQIIAGTDDSNLLVYDVRASAPIQTIQQHLHPVKQIKFIDYGGDRYFLAADQRQLILYQNKQQYQLKCYFEPGCAVHRFDVFSQTGLVAVACEDVFINFFYIPDLGPAPKWAKDLDQQVNQLSIQQQSGQFLNYKFCTQIELEALGIGSAQHSDQIIAYMHGFYVPKAIYKQFVQQNEKEEISNKKQKQSNQNKTITKVKAKSSDERFDFD